MRQLTEKKMERPRIGVVGVGHLGSLHSKVLYQMASAEFVGVFDRDSARARQVAAECKTKAFDRLEDLLSSVEAVNVVTTTTHHFDVAMKALDLGLHVFIEKPITETIQQARKLVAMSKKKKVKVQVGHIERFNPAILALEPYRLQPLFIESHRLAQFNPRGSEVAVVLDLMIHDIDLILSLVRSPVTRIDASGVSRADASQMLRRAGSHRTRCARCVCSNEMHTSRSILPRGWRKSSGCLMKATRRRSRP
ncbi:MAG: Oxidoreductase family, NAD-binding Rossmann fold [Bacteroidetes bacterium]|nr:Oxidoreductase family, NAD-binding Rossmann fold [Bacteroidota bacterium]